MVYPKLLRKIYNNISIKTKLILLILILIIYSVIFMAYISYQSYAKVFKEKAIDSLTKNASVYTSILSDRVDNIIKLSAKLLIDDKLYNANNQLKSGLNDPYISNTETFKSNIELYLTSYLTSREFELIIFRFNYNQKSFYVSKDPNVNIQDILNDKKLLESAQITNGKPTWHFVKKNGKVESIYLTRTISDNMTNEKIGTLIFKINTDFLFSEIRNYLSYDVQNVSIYNEDNDLLFEKNSFKQEIVDQVNKLAIISEPNGLFKKKYKNDTIYIFFNKIASSKWKLAASVSSDMLLFDLKRIMIIIVMLCLITIPIWLVLIYIIYRDIIKPINILVYSMDKIEQGETGITVTTDRNDELGSLFKTFNKMSEEINRLINKVYKEKLLMKDAQIKALQAQINPHFLYNTLETINWKAKLYGVEDISEMITALSSIIEANLNRHDEKMIPIFRELEYIDNYNLLIQKRFGKKISFVKSIDDDALNYKIPKLLIQPLIENSIYHGLETKKGGGTVELIISIEENMLLIIVADDGTGIDDLTLKKLKQNLEDDNENQNENQKENQYENRTKIGIMNVYKRIKLIYGKEYGLNIFSETAKGTTIILKLPFNETQGVDE